MTILAADLNSIFTNVLIVVHVTICILLSLVVLMQRPKQEGLGAAFGGGMTDQAFGARTTDVLQKGTVFLGTLLFIVTLSLAVLVGAKSKGSKLNNAIAVDSEAQIENAQISLPPVEETSVEETPVEVPATDVPTPAETPETPAPAAEVPVAPAPAPAPAPAEQPTAPVQ